MRTFKLIEEYYGSPKLGTVIREDGLGQLVSEQIEIFKSEEILKFPKHWEEFNEVDYTGTKFYYNKWPVIEYYILSKDFEKYTICWNNGNALTQCRIQEVHEYFQNGTYTKIEEPKYVIGFDTACGDGDYTAIYSIKNGIAEIVKQTKITEPFQRHLIDDCIIEAIKENVKNQPPILITKDGVEIFWADTVHVISKNTQVFPNIRVYHNIEKDYKDCWFVSNEKLINGFVALRKYYNNIQITNNHGTLFNSRATT